MKIKNIQTISFKDELTRIRTRIAEDASHHLILHYDTDTDLVSRHICTNSHFCRSVVANGFLTEEKMIRAAHRYGLGMTRDGGVIFWQIGLFRQVYDGKIMYYKDDCHRDHSHPPTWVSSTLKRFYLGDDYPTNDLPATTHCLFGTHLLQEVNLKPVAVVEAEKTAVICSERYPRFIWLATGGLEALKPEVLFPLRGRRIIIFPDTDENGETYSKWYTIALSAQRLLGCSIYVSDYLEKNATPDQKRRKIDLADTFAFHHST